MQTNELIVSMAVQSHLSDLIESAGPRVRDALRYVKHLTLYHRDLRIEITMKLIDEVIATMPFSQIRFRPCWTYTNQVLIDQISEIFDSYEKKISPGSITQFRFVKRLMELNQNLNSTVTVSYLNWLWDEVDTGRSGVSASEWIGWQLERTQDTADIVPVTKRAFIYDSSQASGPYVDVTEWENQDGVDITIEDQSGTRSISLLYDEWTILCDMMSRLAQCA